MATIVIGGGPAGLTAAALLKKQEPLEAVTVLEAHRHLGGRARSVRREGHELNQGPHALYLAGPAMSVLGSLGIDPPGGTAPTKGALARYRGRDRTLPVGAGSLARTSLLTMREKAAVGRVLSRLPKTRTTNLASVSAAEWIEASVVGEAPRELLGGLARLSTYAADLEALSAEVAVSQLQLASGGVRYLDGGWSALVGALEAVALGAGVEVRTGSAVRSAEHEHGAWTVGLDHGELRAERLLVAGLSPRATNRLVGSADLEDRVGDLEAVTAACLDVGLSSAPHPERRFLLGLDEPTYVSLHSAAADLGAGEVIHAMRYGGSPRDDGETRAELEALLEDLQPGWRGKLDTVRYLPRAVVAHSAAAAASGGLAGRPPVAIADRPAVAIAGDWVGPTGHLLDASLASAAAAARHLVHRSAMAGT